jgi:hypothetical protein
MAADIIFVLLVNVFVSSITCARANLCLHTTHLHRYLGTILERCMLLPRAAKVLEYLKRVLAGALKFGTLAQALLNTQDEREGRSLLVRELQDCFSAFSQDLT